MASDNQYDKNMKVILVNGSPHKEGCTYTALLEVEKELKAEGIETGAEEFELNLVDMAKKYNMEVDKLKEFMGESEKEQMKQDMAVQEAVTFLVENAVEE